MKMKPKYLLNSQQMNTLCSKQHFDRDKCKLYEITIFLLWWKLMWHFPAPASEVTN